MSVAEEYYYINNRIVAATEAGLLLNDLGLFRAYSVFDYFRTHQGEPFLMEAYLQRFRASAAQLGLSLGLEEKALAAIIRELIALNKRPESGVRLLLTGGYSENIFKPSTPNLIIRIEKSALPDPDNYTKGIKLLSQEYMRDFPTIKSTNYMNAIRYWPEVEAAGAVELLYHWQGEWLECSRSNFFVVQQGKLLTAPASRVLPGITRGKLLDLARQAGMELEETRLPLAIIRDAEEAFITGTTKRVMPVVQIDEEKIGNGKPGPVSRELLRLWEELEHRLSAGI